MSVVESVESDHCANTRTAVEVQQRIPESGKAEGGLSEEATDRSSAKSQGAISPAIEFSYVFTGAVSLKVTGMDSVPSQNQVQSDDALYSSHKSPWAPIAAECHHQNLSHHPPDILKNTPTPSSKAHSLGSSTKGINPMEMTSDSDGQFEDAVEVQQQRHEEPGVVEEGRAINKASAEQREEKTTDKRMKTTTILTEPTSPPPVTILLTDCDDNGSAIDPEDYRETPLDDQSESEVSIRADEVLVELAPIEGDGELMQIEDSARFDLAAQGDSSTAPAGTVRALGAIIRPQNLKGVLYAERTCPLAVNLAAESMLHQMQPQVDQVAESQVGKPLDNTRILLYDVGRAFVIDFLSALINGDHSKGADLPEERHGGVRVESEHSAEHTNPNLTTPTITPNTAGSMDRLPDSQPVAALSYQNKSSVNHRILPDLTRHSPSSMVADDDSQICDVTSQVSNDKVDRKEPVPPSGHAFDSEMNPSRELSLGKVLEIDHPPPSPAAAVDEGGTNDDADLSFDRRANHHADEDNGESSNNRGNDPRKVGSTVGVSEKKFIIHEKTEDETSSGVLHAVSPTEVKGDEVITSDAESSKPGSNFDAYRPPEAADTKMDTTRGFETRLVEILQHFEQPAEEMINIADIGNIFRGLGMNPSQAQVDRLVEQLNSDDQAISATTFSAMAVDAMESGKYAPVPEQELSAAFEVFDEEANGMMSMDELMFIMTNFGEPLTDEELEKFVEFVEKFSDEDGLVHYAECARGLSPSSISRDVQL